MKGLGSRAFSVRRLLFGILVRICSNKVFLSSCLIPPYNVLKIYALWFEPQLPTDCSDRSSEGFLRGHENSTPGMNDAAAKLQGSLSSRRRMIPEGRVFERVFWLSDNPSPPPAPGTSTLLPCSVAKTIKPICGSLMFCCLEEAKLFILDTCMI